MANKKGGSSLKSAYAVAVLRIGLGIIFLWAFFDKLFGLGFSTCRDAKTNVVSTVCSKAWLKGGSPTDGFLKFGAKGPFADFYHGLAGNKPIAWLFMAGLLLIGLALVLGIGVKIAVITGSVLLFMLWTAVLPPATNPVLDDHIIYIFALIVILTSNQNQKIGLGEWWAKKDIVKKLPILA